MFKHILAATDGSPVSQGAMRSAVGLARLANAQLTFLHCSVPFDVYSVDPLATAQRELYEGAVEKAAHEVLEECTQLARDAGVKSDCEHAFAERPYEGILDVSGKLGCDLIVMGSHGRGGLAGFVLGSQTQKVLSGTKVPVMVAR